MKEAQPPQEEISWGREGGIYGIGFSLFINETITTEMADKLMMEMALKENDPDLDHINFYINSHGGDMGSSVMIAEAMQQCAKPIHTIAIGRVYSGATLILAAGDKGNRWAWPTAIIGLHEVSIRSTEGEERKNIQQLREDIITAETFNTYWLGQVSRYTGQPILKLRKDLKGIDKNFNPEEAKIYGIIDHILYPQKIRNLK